MKIALCISGKWNGIDFSDRTREIIPNETLYTATYTGSEYNADFYMDEPETTYHPVLDTEAYPDIESRGRRIGFIKTDAQLKPELVKLKHASVHWHKQILIHNHLMKNIDCDMVVRARFETVVSDQIDWNEIIERSFEEEIPIGFNTRNIKSNLNHHIIERTIPSFFINDALIVHPKHLWNTELVDTLYNERKLRGAEEGWYQVLSEPFGHYHMSYDGGAYSAKDWEMVLDVDESLHN